MIERCDVAIIGGGPAGLAAAIELKRSGVDTVVVIEREGETGGVPRHCAHPPFGLREFGRILTGPAYAARLSEQARAAGVDVRLRHSVVALHPGGTLDIASPDGPLRLSAARVILATGTRETPRSARLISGTRPIGVVNTGALQAYIQLNALKPFERPLVVGTELVSLSSLATCRSHGIRPVAMIESNSRATARWPLTLFPHLVGVPLHLDTDLVEILGGKRVEAARVLNRRTGSETLIACDGVLLTGQFVPEASLVRSSALEWDPASGGPVVDQHGRCSDPAYFAAGNLLRPVETAGWSFREGRALGQRVARDLRNPASITRRVRLSAGEGLKYVVPQCISVQGDSTALPKFQLRVTEPIKAQLVLRAGDRVIAAASLSSRPERRILFDPAGGRVTSDIQSMTIEAVR